MKCTLIIAALASLAAAKSVQKRQTVFQSTTFNDISIAGGAAGNAQQEALDALSGLPDDLSTVDQADIDFLGEVNSVANDAETDAFNPAIEAATGAEADSLQCGKIKNKVLKLTATMLKLQAQAAQGEDVADKMAEEQKKLDNNIAQDEDAAGTECTDPGFDADIAA